MAPEAKRHPLGKVMVIGGCGFLGHHIVRQLVEDYSADISVVDLRCDKNRRPEADGVAYVEADISDPERLMTIFESARPDVVVHTASPAPQTAAYVSDAHF